MSWFVEAIQVPGAVKTVFFDLFLFTTGYTVGPQLAQSKVPALGYTVPYAIGNILLTAWGPVLVTLLSIGR